jgi:hypothetical protein
MTHRRLLVLCRLAVLASSACTITTYEPPPPRPAGAGDDKQGECELFHFNSSGCGFEGKCDNRFPYDDLSRIFSRDVGLDKVLSLN